MINYPHISAAQLIRESYILAHVINAQEEPDGYLAAQALSYLNETLSEWGAIGIYIPFLSQLSIDLIANQYLYPVQQVIATICEASVMTPSNVLLPLVIANDKQFWGFNYLTSAGTPKYVYLHKEEFYPNPESPLLGSQLTFYPVPVNSFSANLLVKYNLSTIPSLASVIPNIPPYYIKALRYQLASDLSNLHATKMTRTFSDELNKLINHLKSLNHDDLSVLNQNEYYQYRRFKPWGYYVG